MAEPTEPEKPAEKQPSAEAPKPEAAAPAPEKPAEPPKAEPVVEAPKPEPVEAKAPQAEVPQAKPADPPATGNDELAKARAKWEADLQSELAKARQEAADAARKEERERLEKEHRRAKMSEAERLADEKAEAEAAAKKASDLAKAAEQKAEVAERKLMFSRALANADATLARDSGGRIDPSLEELAFAEAQRIAGDDGDLAEAIGQLREAKPWMFARADRSDQPSNTGSKTPPARRAGSEPRAEKPIFKQTDDEYRKTRRKLGIVS